MTNSAARRALLVVLVVMLFGWGTLQAHDFGGGTGPGGGPGGDGCPGCCGGGGGDPCAGGGGCGSSGGPVNFWDGAERHTIVDINIPGYQSIQFQRIYDSRVDYDSSLGYGWAHSYDLRLFRYPDGSVMLRRTCGGRRLFVPSGGDFISPPGEFRNELVDDGDGTLTLVEPSGAEYAFDLRGRLESITDVHGNSLELIYDPGGRLPLTGTSKFSPDPAAAGIVALDYRLTQVRERDALGSLTGRQITLAYDGGTGRLDTVTDHTGRTWTYGHDTLGNLTSVSAPESVTHTYAYADSNDAHNLTSLDEGTMAFTLEYDTEDRVMRQTFAAGTVIDIVYDIPLLQTTVTKTVKDSGGATLRTGNTVWEFNAFGNPTKVTDALGNEISMTRDAEGNVQVQETRQFVSGTGLVLIKSVGRTFDAAGNVMQEVHTQHDTGEVVTKDWTYDHNLIATERISSSLDPSQVHGYDRTYDHNAGGYPTVLLQEDRIVADGGTPTPVFYTITNTYNSFGQLTVSTYPNGNTDTLGYTDGYVTSSNNETFTRDARGNLLTRTNGNSNTWTYTYDDLDRVATSEDPTGSQSVYTYTGLHLTRLEAGKTVSAAGSIFEYTQDGMGRLTQIERQTTGGLLTVLTMDLDSEGNPVQVTDGAGRSLTRTYDLLDRLETYTNGASETTTYEYDAFGNRTSVTDGAGRNTSYENWLMEQPGKPLTVTNGLNKTYTAVLDALGNLKTLTDPFPRVLTETHDAMGRLLSFATPSGATTTLTYNGRGLLETRTDPLTQVTTYTYNPRGFLTSIDNDGSETVTLTRDPGDRLTRVVDADSDISYAYDGVDRVTLETNNLTGRSMTYTYNPRGLKTSVTTSDGVSVTYEYDELEYLSAIRRNTTLEASYVRDNAGLPITTTYANGNVVTYTRDGMGRVDVQETRDSSSTLLSRVDYTRDLGGLISVKHEIIMRPDLSTAESFTHYTYDLAGRLMREEIREADDITISSARDFTYDDVGNRLTMSFDGGPTTTYVYGTDHELLSETTGASSITYAYDANGNILTETFGPSVVTYSWDIENRLVGLNSPSDVATYALSLDGRRLSKTVNAVTTEFLYDGMNVAAEYPQAAPPIYYTTGLGLDDWVLRVEGTSKRYYHSIEDLRSVMQLTNESGAVDSSYVYQAFGELLESNVNTPNVYTFTGRRQDAETEHLYFRERLYSSRTGRFLTLDPYRPDGQRTARIGNPDRLALSKAEIQSSPLFDARRQVNVTGMDVTGYIYVGNSPLNATDPTGEVLVWNPASFSVTSGCAGSVCFGSGCLGSGCGGSGCGGSGCYASGCGLSGCIGSACGGSACGGSGCGGSGCAGSACVTSVCFLSGCVISGCGGSACAGSGCVGSVCGLSSTCIGSACLTSGCFGSTCGISVCTASGCGDSTGCTQSGCGGSACNAGSGCNHPCCP